MPKQKNAFQAAIGKLIVEMDRVYITQVEDAQPLESIELALDKAHQLLHIDSIVEVRKRIGTISLAHHFGNVWLDAWPSVAAKVAEAQDVLDQA